MALYVKRCLEQQKRQETGWICQRTDQCGSNAHRKNYGRIIHNRKRVQMLKYSVSLGSNHTVIQQNATEEIISLVLSVNENCIASWRDKSCIMTKMFPAHDK